MKTAAGGGAPVAVVSRDGGVLAPRDGARDRLLLRGLVAHLLRAVRHPRVAQAHGAQERPLHAHRARGGALLLLLHAYHLRERRLGDGVRAGGVRALRVARDAVGGLLGAVRGGGARRGAAGGVAEAAAGGGEEVAAVAAHRAEAPRCGRHGEERRCAGRGCQGWLRAWVLVRCGVALTSVSARRQTVEIQGRDEPVDVAGAPVWGTGRGKRLGPLMTCVRS